MGIAILSITQCFLWENKLFQIFEALVLSLWVGLMTLLLFWGDFLMNLLINESSILYLKMDSIMYAKYFDEDYQKLYYLVRNPISNFL